MNSNLLLVILLFISSFPEVNFKDDQLRYPRVRQAFRDKEESVKSLLDEHGIDIKNLEVYIRGFKREKQLELWGKNSGDKSFTLLKVYEICRTSGVLGPKREEGDFQIPEGYYHINVFNPHSNFHLSLGINYPNRSDRILGTRGNLGGNIFIHGACATIGCVPITDEQIKELYILCVEAKNNGQLKIPVTLFPSKLTEEEFSRLKSTHEGDPGKIELWSDLKNGYDLFNENHTLPSVEFLGTGRHRLK